MFRVEDKYIMPPEKMLTLEKRISYFLPLDGEGGNDGYKISSLYFDDIYDTMLRDSLDGNPIREKYRIRIYNGSFDTIKLEVKQKRYNRVSKITSYISKEELRMLVEGKEISDQRRLEDARTLFNIAIKRKCLRPQLHITYERRAYIFEPGNVRITFDRNIRASKELERFGDPNINYDYPKESVPVLEVKYDQFIPRFIMQMLESGNMIQASNSKYGICRQIYERGE